MPDHFIIETRNLTKEFNGFLAVSDINLRVRRGQIHALIGPNGARILRTGARLLLLDEISEGLAPVIVQRLSQTIQELRRRGYTIVMVEQNFRFAAIADFGGTVLGRKIVTLVTDHQNKPDIGASKFREWADQNGLSVLLGGSNTGVSIAMSKVAAAKKNTLLRHRRGGRLSDERGLHRLHRSLRL